MESLGGVDFSGCRMQPYRREHADTADSRMHYGHESRRFEHGHRGHHVTGKDPHHGHGKHHGIDDKSSVEAPESASREVLTYRSAERTTLYIQTQEGDTVRLRIKARDSVAIDATAIEAGSRSTVEFTMQTRSSTRISISVDGDLNADELTAIRGVIEQAGMLAEEFYAGDMPAAFSAAAEFQIDANQLAKVGMRMSLREQFTYSQQEITRAVIEKAAEQSVASERQAASAPDPAAGIPEAIPSNGDAAPEAVNPSVAVSTSVNAGEQISDPDNGVTNAAMESSGSDSEEPGRSPAGILDRIAEYLQQLLESLQNPVLSDQAVASVDLSLKLKVFQSTLTAFSAPEGSSFDRSELPVLADETLDALIARNRAQLHIHV